MDYLKKPLTQSLQAWGKGKAADAVWAQGRCWPCTVSQVISSGIVEVNFEVNAGPTLTLSKIIIPILSPEYIRYPIQVGDKGMTVGANTLLGGLTGLGAGVAQLSQPANLAGLAFLWLGSTTWMTPLDTQAVELYGPNGVNLYDKARQTIMRLGPSGITITLGGPLTVESNGHDVQVNGGGDVVAGTISLKTHVHSGVTTGGADTGAPV